MEDTKKALPNIIKIRAERVLRKPVHFAYRVNDEDANLIAAVMQNGDIRYIDLREKREVKASQLKVSLASSDEQPKEEAPAVKKANTAMISRENVLPDDLPVKKTRAKKQTDKSTAAKKAGAKKKK